MVKLLVNGRTLRMNEICISLIILVNLLNSAKYQFYTIDE